MKKLALFLIRLYQLFISPMLGPICRFTPSCSQYAWEAIQKYGLYKGTRLAFSRLCRCNPRCLGGHDPLL